MMQSYRCYQLNGHLRKYDPYLFCKQDGAGKIHIFHKGLFRISWVATLTDSWQADGDPVDWGVLPVLERLQYIQADRLMDDYDKLMEKRDRKEKDLKRANKHELEAMAAEMRPLVRDAFKDINTSTLNKVDSRRKKDRKYANTKP